jgi:prolyl-tRNA synthetase
MASIIEQNHDDKGIIWPLNIAPFKVGIVVINNEDEKQIEIANNLYENLMKANIECLLDDRDERAGVKFNDMDLIGIPIRITIGNKIKDNIIEMKLRDNTVVEDIKVTDVYDYINKITSDY